MKPAKLSGQSVSAMAEFILRQGLKQPAGEPRNNAVAAAIALLAENIEAGTKETRLTDPWTGFALCNAAEHLLLRFMPAPEREGMPPAPSAVKEAAAKMHPDHAEQFCKPHFFGRELAQFLILEIEQASSSATPMNGACLFFSQRNRKSFALLGVISG